jgi:hypothetical protein
MSFEEALALARQVTTAPEALAALASHARAEVREAVAGNPSAPAAALREGLLEWPEAVLANPTWDLMQLEQPDLLESLDPARQQLVAASPRCPVGWAERVLRSPDADDEVQQCLLLNGALPLEARRRAFCAHEPGWQAGEALALAAALGEDFWSLVVRADFDEDTGGSPDPSLTEADLCWLAERGPLGQWLAVRQPGCPVPLLEAEARYPSPLRRAEVARHPRAPAGLRRALAADEDPRVRAAVAMAPELEVGVAVALALDPSSLVQAAVLGRASLAEEVVQALLERGSGQALEWLARREDLPVQVLAALARDAQVKVRVALAERARLPAEVVAVLAVDPAKAVRGALAMSGAATVEEVERLAADPEREVAEMARFALLRRR